MRPYLTILLCIWHSNYHGPRVEPQTFARFKPYLPLDRPPPRTASMWLGLHARLALVWRSSGVYIHMWKNAHIFEHAENVRRGWRTQKINDVHQAFSSNHNEFWRTPSESQRPDQNSLFLVRWTRVMVCVTGALNSCRVATRALHY